MTKLKLLTATLGLGTMVFLSGCSTNELSVSKQEPTFLETYSKIAQTNYADALTDAKNLEESINKFAQNPTLKSLQMAKASWLISRETYGQTEIFRLSNGPIDAEDGWVSQKYEALEGQLNAWPLDENMIDYTIDANGHKTSGNIIDTTGKFNPGGEDSTTVNISTITTNTLAQLNENGGEANVATGYHAIEFLLWGQDQDYSNFIKDNVTKGALTAGQRPLSDFTTDKFAPRRLSYLKAAASKLVQDLQMVNSAWNGEALYASALQGKLTGEHQSKNIKPSQALKQIYSGMGVFIKSELANERIAVAVLTPSEEDEHSCFSDNTHRDITTNYQGFKNILLGTYKGIDFGTSAIEAMNQDDQTRILSLMSSIESKIASINAIAQTSRHFDQQIQPNDPQAKVIVKLKNQMRKLGDEMVNISKANGINLSVEDVTDSEETKL